MNLSWKTLLAMGIATTILAFVLNIIYYNLIIALAGFGFSCLAGVVGWLFGRRSVRKK